MEQLSLRCFGVPEVHYGGQNLKFRSRKEVALLIYLAVEGRQHSHEQLIALFWPESDRQHGQASLRNTLARLRQGMAGAESYLIIMPSTVGFAVDRPFEFDLHVVQATHQTLHTPTKPAALTTLQAALALYRGDFLAGFALADAP